METTHKIFISRLKYRTRFISAVPCDYFAEACITALEKQGHC